MLSCHSSKSGGGGGGDDNEGRDDDDNYIIYINTFFFKFAVYGRPGLVETVFLILANTRNRLNLQ